MVNCLTHVQECPWSTVCCFCRFAVCCGLDHQDDQLSIRWERMSGASSSQTPELCVLVQLQGLVGVVVTIGVVGLGGCLNLLIKSLSMESHVKPSCPAVSQVGELRPHVPINAVFPSEGCSFFLPIPFPPD